VKRLALFDIDCTLIDAHGAGGRAVLQAIDDVYGVHGELGEYSFHGRTDPGIVRDLVALWGALDAQQVVGKLDGETQPRVVTTVATRLGASADVIEARLEECLTRYIELLRAEIARGRMELLPGVRELVTALAADRRVLVGLLTGNVEAGAQLKLAPTGLASLFKVAAYGSDSGWRPDLPAVAVRRAEELTGRRYSGKEIAVIGDTPADIVCGARLGVKAIAVATGRHGVSELATHKPDYVFADMSDWRAVYEAILA
jgi:phosphoglycolate phosphatase-like HAD superfamily hydrolase